MYLDKTDVIKGLRRLDATLVEQVQIELMTNFSSHPFAVPTCFKV